ncbi:hypothetical protein BGZ82_000259, partial [Podila clonocystis]
QTGHIFSVDKHYASDGYNSGSDPLDESDTNDSDQAGGSDIDGSSPADESDSSNIDAEEDSSQECKGETGSTSEQDLASDLETSANESARKARLKALRQKSLERLANTWQDIIERYSLKAASGRPDFEIDLTTGNVHDEHGVSSYYDRRIYARLGKSPRVTSRHLNPSPDSSLDPSLDSSPDSSPDLSPDSRSNVFPSNDSLGEYYESELSCRVSDISNHGEQEFSQFSDNGTSQDDESRSEWEDVSKRSMVDIEHEERKREPIPSFRRSIPSTSGRQSYESDHLHRESVQTSDSDHTTHTYSPSSRHYRPKLVASSPDELDDFTSRVSERLEYEPQDELAWSQTLDTKLNIDFSLLWPSDRPQADVGTHDFKSLPLVSPRRPILSEMTPKGAALLDSLMSIRRGGGTLIESPSGPKRKRISLSPERVLY